MNAFEKQSHCTYPVLLFATLLLFSVCGCLRERSNEDGKNIKPDSLPADYPFATGYCEGVSLGMPVVDTAVFVPASERPLPDSLVLRMPKAGNQGAQKSCAAWAVVYGAGTQYVHSKTGKPFSDTGNLSPRFTYNQITKGDCKCTSLLDNLYLLKNQGSASLQIMPYRDADCAVQPDSQQRKKAEPNQIQGWQRVNLRDSILVKRALSEGKPVLFAIAVDEGLTQLKAPYVWKARTTLTGELHAMVITGYSNGKKAFRFMNSWSVHWGDEGFAWIDYDFFTANAQPVGYVIL